MLNHLFSNKLLWFFAGVLSLTVSLSGVINPWIYSKVISPDFLPGTISQDIITIISASSLIVLALIVKEKETKKPVIALSLLAYLFYGYGIWVIEQVYTSLYLAYIAIFSLSFWSLVYGLLSVRKDIVTRISLAKSVRLLSVVTAGIICVLFYSLWTSQLLPLLREGHKIEFTYSIYILDMVFILPALIISAILAVKNIGWGLLLLPALFFKAFTLLFSVGLGGLLKPYFQQTMSTGETGFYLGLSFIFLLFSLINLKMLHIPLPKHK